jgi:hypothetical protein
MGVHSELLPWQHTSVIKAFLYQGHAPLALRYIRVASPPTSTPAEVKLRMTVLLANGFVNSGHVPIILISADSSFFQSHF